MMPPVWKFCAVPAGMLLGAVFTGLPALSEEIDHRQSCEPWEYVAPSEELGNPATAMLFCTNAEGKLWRALQVSCLGKDTGIRIVYEPGYDVRSRVKLVAATIAGDAESQTFSEEEETPDYWSDAGTDQFYSSFAESGDETSLPEEVNLNGEGDEDPNVTWEDADIPDPEGFADPDKAFEGSALISFLFYSTGYHHRAFEVSGRTAWEMVVKNVNHATFNQLRFASFVDVYFGPAEQGERFPLKKSDLSLRPLVQWCRKN